MAVAARSRVTIGVTMISVGLGLYGLQYLQGVGDAVILMLLGVLCIGGYLYSRSGLLIVAGGVLFGLGLGGFGEQRYWVYGEFSQIGLGLGFILIYVIRLIHERRSHWWPLIPGTVLILLGFQAWRDFREFLFDKGWPLIFVIIGVLVLLGAIGKGRKPKAEKPH